MAGKWTMQELDRECNKLFRELDAMKAAKQDRNDNAVYMQTLYALRDMTRLRIGASNG